MRCLIPKSGLVGLLAALLLSACASQVPPLIRQAPVDSPSLGQVNGHIEDHVGQSVRWGGPLIAIDNQENSSRLTVLAWPLGSNGEPRHSDESDGRFIAIVPVFLDPAVYVANRLVTVTGTLVRSETEQIGEHPYVYPVVEAQAWYLWPEPAAHGYRYPGWYDPWYDPWYGSWWYSPWYDPWYSPGWYPYRNPGWRPHAHPKPAPVSDGKHSHPRPDGRPHRDGPRTPGDGAQRPRREPRGVESAPPAPAGDGDSRGDFRRFRER